MNERPLLGADGIILGKNRVMQRVIVPESTLDYIFYMGGLEMIEGEVIDLIPQNKGEPIIPIFDILVLASPGEPSNN